MLLNIALQWHDQGIATIPIGYKSKRPTLAWKQYQTKLPTKHELKRWFDRKYVNIAIITGWQDLVIIDFDNIAIWELWQLWANDSPATYRVKTARGVHVYYFIKNPPQNTLKMPGIDVKAAGGYCLIPPSIHPTGAKYLRMGDDSITTVNCLEDVLPSGLLEQAQKPIQMPKNNNGTCDPWNIPANGNSNSIQWIKTNRNILEMFPSAKQTSRDGRWYSDYCPLHKDRHRSFWIDIVRQKCGCQACLNQSLDIIDLVCLIENIDRGSAIRRLSNG